MKKKILIISPVATHPPFAGNSACILAYANLLKDLGYNVSFLWIAHFDPTKEQEELSTNYWGSNFYSYGKNQVHRVFEAFFRFFHFKLKGNFKVDDYYPFGIKKFITQLQKQEAFDCVIINYIFLSGLSKYFTNSKKILYTHDVFTNKFKNTGLKWFSVTSNEEAKALDRVDITLAIQENEAIFYRYLTQKKVLTAFSYFPVSLTGYTGKKTLLYLAGPNAHNLESIDWFLNNVFKQLSNSDKEVRLLIGGGICREIESKYRNNSIIFYGEVNDALDFYEQGDIFINPTFNGTGLKIKTFEAMSYGKVLISHPHNTIGIYKKEEAPILIADNPKDYINHINSILNNESKAKELKQSSIDYINELNGVVKSRFIEAIEG